jgi:sodium/proline symporter
VGVALAVAAVITAGGPGAILTTLEKARPELLGSFGTTQPPQALAWYLLFCLGTCAQPHYLQKFLFLRSPGQLRGLPFVLTGALVATLAVWIGVGFAGTALVERGNITLIKGDDLTPAVMGYLGPWAMVLTGAVVLAAMMSTAASFLNLSAAALTRDLPQAMAQPPRSVNTARWATVLVAGVATALGAASDRAVALLGVIGWGFFTAALLPAMTIGLLWRRARAHAITGAIAVGAMSDLILELYRSRLPVGLEPGLAGAAIGAIVLVMLSVGRR